MTISKKQKNEIYNDYKSSKKKLIDSRYVLKMFEKLKKVGNIKDSYNKIDPNKKILQKSNFARFFHF